jgi:hypothetical protein
MFVSASVLAYSGRARGFVIVLAKLGASELFHVERC